jgi:hypothetical protein
MRPVTDEEKAAVREEAEATAGEPQPGSRKARGRRTTREADTQIVAVHFRDIIPGLDIRGLGQRAFKPGEPAWRGYDVEVVPGFVVLTAPARDGKRAVFRVPEDMCIVVTEVAA